jgi:hypothetical protein
VSGKETAFHDYEQGAIDAFELIMRAIVEVLPEPHNDPAMPTREQTQVEEIVLDTLREVAYGRLALFDPGDLAGSGFKDVAREKANEVLARHRRVATAIVEANE